MKDKYGLIGFPLKHSFSHTFFNEKFEKENINAEYFKFEIPEISYLTHIIESNPELKGLNVTIPYKEQVIRFMDEIDPDAKQIGAINVIKFIRDGNSLWLKGYNSDIIGFQNSLAPLLKEYHKKALVLGTGGASKAVTQALKNLGIESQYVSRTKRDNTICYNELDKEKMDEYLLIINTSPLGTFPNNDECPDIPYDLLTKRHLLYDLVYNPPQTKFLRLGAEKGAETKNGSEMLTLQAIGAWEIWNKPE